MMTSIRIPPQDLEAEKALLGSVMMRPESVYEVVDLIKPDSFYATKHKLIFESMLDLHSNSEPIDLVSLTGRMKERKNLDQIGGASYLAEIVNFVPSSANAEHYAKVVQKKHVLRRLIDAANTINELGYNEEKELHHVLDEAEKTVYEIGNVAHTKNNFISLKDTLDEAWERLDRLNKSGEELRGVPTGFKALDHKLAGLQKSDLIILAARPSMGKTSLALDIARQAACKHNAKVGIFSLEMSSQQLVDRMLAADSFVDSWKLRTGRLSTDQEFTTLRESLEKLAKAPIYIDDSSDNDIIKMRSTARRLKSQSGLDLIIVDYLQLMQSHKKVESLVQQVTEISRSLKGLARELDIPVIALSQLSRAVEQRGGEPRLSDLRDSGSIEQDADVVLFIHRDDKYDKESTRPNIAKIIIAKHRNGPTGDIELFFDEKRVSFMELDENRAEGVMATAEFGGF
ncbi:MAG: replicative DNA helicase [Candidatus Paceibacterota bacterium]|jgi:replicative DNA helicase